MTSAQSSTRSPVVPASRTREFSPLPEGGAKTGTEKNTAAGTHKRISWLGLVMKVLAAIIMLAAVGVFILSAFDDDLSVILGGFVLVLGIGLGLVLLCGGVLITDVKAIKAYLQIDD